LAQLRHVRTAIWSGESPVEDEKDVLPPAQVRKPEHASLEVGEFEIGSRGVDCDTGHSYLVADPTADFPAGMRTPYSTVR